MQKNFDSTIVTALFELLGSHDLSVLESAIKGAAQSGEGVGIAWVQRRLLISYAQAVKIVDSLREAGVFVASSDGDRGPYRAAASVLVEKQT